MSARQAPTVPSEAGASAPSGSFSAAGLWGALHRLPATVLVGLVRGYQLIVSPWTAPTCRYYPSCSQYAVIAVRRHGALRGGWLAVRRLGRCHPWTPGGIDDVPPARDEAPNRIYGPQRAGSST